MKNISSILTFIFILSIASCGKNKTHPNADKQTIDFSLVEFVEIRKQSSQTNTIQSLPKRLTNEQSKIFVEGWNNAKSKGACKYIVHFWIDVKFKEGTTRTFRINGENIKEINDWCYEFDDNALITQLFSNVEN